MVISFRFLPAIIHIFMTIGNHGTSYALALTATFLRNAMQVALPPSVVLHTLCLVMIHMELKQETY